MMYSAALLYVQADYAIAMAKSMQMGRVGRVGAPDRLNPKRWCTTGQVDKSLKR